MLVETDDIDLSILRAAVEEYERLQQLYYNNELPVAELHNTINN